MLEANCGACGETFNPADESDTEHCVRMDGTECGGQGVITGSWGEATEVIHHVTRYSREISCGATGPVRVEEIAMRVTCPECKAADYAKLTAEAERQAYAEDGERYAAGVIAGSRADQDAIALDLAAMVPADVDDAAAWEVYCKALPEPTDAQIADVLAEYGDPYAAARADAVAAFKNAARSIWKMRAANQTDTLAVDTIGSLRGSMRTLRDCIEIFDQLTESWQQEMRASAARDSYTVTAPYFGRRS